MIRTLIVDDDALVRATLPSLLDWESCGYRIVQDCRSGQQALDFLRVHDIDLLITDIKMPGMGGLKLLERLRESGRMPVSVVLSGYDEFELVREAFRLGAYDYLLKSNLSEASLRRLLDDLRHKVFRDAAAQEAGPDRAEPALEAGRYIPAVFSIRNFPQAAQRYGGDLREKMQRPMLELARQIPRLSAHAVIRAVDPSCYELYYKVSDPLRAQSAVELAVRQLQRVWKDMMNLEVAAGVGGIVPHTEVSAAIPQCAALCSLAGLREPGAYCTVWGYGELADSVIREVPSCEELLDALFEGGGREGDRQAAAWFVELRGAAGQAHTGRCAALLVGLNQRLHTCGQSLSAILPEQPDLLGTLQRLDSAGERELRLHGVLRRVQAACAAGGAGQAQPDVMERAKAFIQDNFVNPELTLKTVADYVGFNEKYFSTRFAKECGCTFIAYLNGLRIQRAGQLLLQTDMKIYEVCEAVGYNNVEHFNHPHLHLLPAVHPGGRCRRRRQGINRQTFFSHLLFFFDQGPGPFAGPGP